MRQNPQPAPQRGAHVLLAGTVKYGQLLEHGEQAEPSELFHQQQTLCILVVQFGQRVTKGLYLPCDES